MPRRDGIADPWGARTPYEPGQPWSARVDTYLVDDLARRRRARGARGQPGGRSLAQGVVRARGRVSGVRDGVLLLPFHYGYWDRAANELTVTTWGPAPTTTAFRPVGDHVPATSAGRQLRSG